MEIVDLFGVKDNNRSIQFNKDITILVGKNGSGKTTVLNILNDVASKRFKNLFTYKFSSITIVADEGQIEIKHRNDGSIVVKRLDVEKVNRNFKFEKNALEKLSKDIKNDKINLSKISNKEIDEEFYKFISSVYLEIELKSDENDFRVNNVYDEFAFNLKSLYFPTYRRSEIDLNSLMLPIKFREKVFRVREYDSEYGNMILGNVIFGFTNKDIEELIVSRWRRIGFVERHQLNSLVEEFISIFFDLKIDDVDTETISTINLADLKMNLEEAFKRTGILHGTIKIDEFIEEIEWTKQYMIDMKNKDSEGEQFIENEDLLKEFFVNITRYTQAINAYSKIQKILNLYKTTCEKIEKQKAPFRELEEKLADFLEMKVEIDEKMKFIPQSTSKKYLRFEDLSAGEKQLVSMFVYTRLHMTKIILIDEPELSLHVSWQRKFIENIYKENSQLIMSTHTPFIISGFSDKVIEIGEVDK